MTSNFDCHVAPNGYAWWYLDVLSDDGAHGLTIIGFVGSVFSPYYALARRRAAPSGADPSNHCAINVALYSRRGSRWTMTERGRGQVFRSADVLQVGPSAMRWTGDALRIEVDEVTVPWPSRLRGCVTVHIERRANHPIELAPQHHWFPMAPTARAEVDLGGQRWSGHAYLDSNQGDAPLEMVFRRWDWSRSSLSGGRSAVFYDVDRLSQEPLQLGLLFNPDGSVESIIPPRRIALSSTAWRIERQARSEAVADTQVLQTLTDAPFYARSLLRTRCMGESVKTMHESLSLTRFTSRVTQALLPFRMPRRQDGPLPRISRSLRKTLPA